MIPLDESKKLTLLTSAIMMFYVVVGVSFMGSGSMVPAFATLFAFACLLLLVRIGYRTFFVKYGKNKNIVTKGSPAVEETHVDDTISTGEDNDSSSGGQLNDLVSRETGIRDKYFAYLDSVELSLKYPMMRDTSNDLIIHLNSCLSNATSLRRTVDDSTENIFGTDYAKAVFELESAFAKAETMAKRSRETFLGEEEQRSIRTAQKMLNIALNISASPNERQVAYRKVLSIMDSLAMPISQRARYELESKSGNEILCAITQ